MEPYCQQNEMLEKQYFVSPYTSRNKRCSIAPNMVRLYTQQCCSMPFQTYCSKLAWCRDKKHYLLLNFSSRFSKISFTGMHSSSSTQEVWALEMKFPQLTPTLHCNAVVLVAITQVKLYSPVIRPVITEKWVPDHRIH